MHLVSTTTFGTPCRTPASRFLGHEYRFVVFSSIAWDRYMKLYERGFFQIHRGCLPVLFDLRIVGPPTILPCYAAAIHHRSHSNRAKIVSYAKRRISERRNRRARVEGTARDRIAKAKLTHAVGYVSARSATFAKTCRSVGVSTSLAINLNNKWVSTASKKSPPQREDACWGLKRWIYDGGSRDLANRTKRSGTPTRANKTQNVRWCFVIGVAVWRNFQLSTLIFILFNRRIN